MKPIKSNDLVFSLLAGEGLKTVSLAASLFTISANSLAADAWLCETSDGHRYKATQSVPVDSCRKLQDAELFSELSELAAPPKRRQRPDSQLFCKSNKNATCHSSDDETSERGEMKGVAYHINMASAGVAALEGADPGFYGSSTRWDISCTRDKMTNRRSCIAFLGDLYLVFRQDGSAVVSIGNDHFPTSMTSIKIGHQRFDTMHRDGEFAQSPKIIGMLRDGTTVVTRYMKWPYRSWVDNEIKLYGADATIQIARWMVKNAPIE